MSLDQNEQLPISDEQRALLDGQAKFLKERQESAKRPASKLSSTEDPDELAAIADLSLEKGSIKVPRSKQTPPSTVPPEMQVAGARSDYDLDKRALARRRSQ